MSVDTIDPRFTKERSHKSVLAVRDLGVTYGSGVGAVEAIRELSFEIGHGELVCIVGPSGCGKTTLLKAIAGLLRPTKGHAVVNGRQVDGPPEDLALVFQSYERSLLPWLTVSKNVTFPLRASGVGRAERDERARAALAEVGLAPFEHKYPWQLSGGMQQRVAIARAIAYRPAVLLMDEPFASVDAQSRADLEDLVLRVQQGLGMTILFITHDIDEAVYLGHRVLVLSRSPTTIRSSLVVDLPFPRDQVSTKAMPKFVELRTTILRLIQDERKAAARDSTARPLQPPQEERS
jgi:NitT/TauT family transport system ATP-binding protein